MTFASTMQHKTSHTTTHSKRENWIFYTSVNLCGFKRRSYVAAYKINSIHRLPGINHSKIFLEMITIALISFNVSPERTLSTRLGFFLNKNLFEICHKSSYCWFPRNRNTGKAFVEFYTTRFIGLFPHIIFHKKNLCISLSCTIAKRKNSLSQ